MRQPVTREDPAQDEALQDSVLVLLGELEHVEVAA
jgi:hypothetical protein